MPRRDRFDDDRVFHSRRKSKTGLLVGLAVGAGILVIAMIVVAVVLSSRKSRHSDDDSPVPGVANSRKPKGERTVGTFQEADDPTIVDRTWPRLIGTWDPVDRPDAGVMTFFSDYQYRTQSTDFDGRPRDEMNPVTLIRDDSKTTSAKTNECVTIFYQEGDAENGRMGGVVFNFFPDGTMDVNGIRYRRRK